MHKILTKEPWIDTSINYVYQKDDDEINLRFFHKFFRMKKRYQNSFQEQDLNFALFSLVLRSGKKRLQNSNAVRNRVLETYSNIFSLYSQDNIRRTPSDQKKFYLWNFKIGIIFGWIESFSLFFCSRNK